MIDRAEYLQVITTVGTADEAQQLALHLVEQRLAACVQVVGPIQSVYRWQGKIEQSQEWQCVAKTTAEHYAALEEAIRAQHSYDMPEILATPILFGSYDYLEWIHKELAWEHHEIHEVKDKE